MSEKSIAKYDNAKNMLSTDAFKTSIARVLPAHLTPDRMARLALTAMTKTPKLADCTPESVMSCMIDCSRLGLEPDGYHAHLIPYNSKEGMICTLIPDYKGLLRLLFNTGLVSKVFADKVCKGDMFRYSKGVIIDHSIDFSHPRGETYAYYCSITFKDGSTRDEVMTLEEILKVKARSKSKDNGPWVTDFDEMAKKTVFKRARKWVPMSATNVEQNRAVVAFQEANEIDDSGYGAVIDVDTGGSSAEDKFKRQLEERARG